MYYSALVFRLVLADHIQLCFRSFPRLLRCGKFETTEQRNCAVSKCETVEFMALARKSLFDDNFCFSFATSLSIRITMRSLLQVVSLLSNLKPNESVSTLMPVPENESDTFIIKHLMGNYDFRTRPKGINESMRNGGPVVVSVNMLLRTISKIDDVNMEYSTQFTFRESWTDDRLAYADLFAWDNLGSIPKFVLLTPDDVSQRVWMPDTFFQNEKSAQRHMIDRPNVLIRVYSNGDVLYSIRLSLVLSCPMSLKMYPLDKQICLIDLASYAYTTSDILYQWKNDTPIQLKDTVKSSLPSFDLVAIKTGYCTSKTSTGEYSCLRVELHFQRMLSYYLLQFYLPSFMLVIVSWLSFWVDKSSVPARVALGVTTLLTITTQASGINQKLPPVSYVKAIDIWIGVCLAFVFGALMEFALVNYAATEDKRKKDLLQIGESDLPTTTCCMEESAESNISTTFVPEVNDYGGLKMTALNRWQHKGHNDPSLSVSIFSIPTPKVDSCYRSRFYNAPTLIYDRLKNYVLKIYYTYDRPKKIDVAARFLFPATFLFFNIIYWCAYL